MEACVLNEDARTSGLVERGPIKEEIALMSCGPSTALRATCAFEEVHMPPDKWGCLFSLIDPSVVEEYPVSGRSYSVLEREPRPWERDGCKGLLWFGFLIFLFEFSWRVIWWGPLRQAHSMVGRPWLSLWICSGWNNKSSGEGNKARGGGRTPTVEVWWGFTEKPAQCWPHSFQWPNLHQCPQQCMEAIRMLWLLATRSPMVLVYFYGEELYFLPS